MSTREVWLKVEATFSLHRHALRADSEIMNDYMTMLLFFTRITEVQVDGFSGSLRLVRA